MTHSAKILLAVVLGWSGIFCAALRAQTSAPVYVSFTFKTPSAAANFKTPALLAKAQDEITQRLTTVFQGEFKWWTFQPAQNDQQFPRFEVFLSESLSWWVYIKFVPAAGFVPEPDAPPIQWRGKFFEPTDFEAMIPQLRAEGWGPTVERGIRDTILFDRTGALFAVLRQHAPLGYLVKLTDAAPDPATLPVVLPLDWRRYQDLSASLFTIRCRSSTGPVLLHSAGLESFKPYTASQPPFDGLVVSLREWQRVGDKTSGPIAEHLLALSSLQPVRFFLKEQASAYALAPH